jgi:plasmid stabilization system protein ParE
VTPHAFHPEAAQEYADAARHYARIGPELGGRFYDEMERLIGDIRRNPDRFRIIDPPARRHFSDVFPYALIYLEQPDRVWIVAVMHFSRRPGYWRQRLP